MAMIARSPVGASWQNTTCSWPDGARGRAPRGCGPAEFTGVGGEVSRGWRPAASLSAAGPSGFPGRGGGRGVCGGGGGGFPRGGRRGGALRGGGRGDFRGVGGEVSRG